MIMVVMKGRWEGEVLDFLYLGEGGRALLVRRESIVRDWVRRSSGVG